jgi:Domain of unknown function (DUF4395)
MDAPVRVTYVRRVHQNQQSELPGTSDSAGTVRGSVNANGRLSDWMARNLLTQGYCLAAEERTQLRLGLRFATGLCFPLVALALESSTMLVALAAIGAVAGLTPRHPFELVWNYGIRHAFAAPPLPPNPIRRRNAFKIGATWLLAVAALFAADLTTAALVLGGVLLVACGIVTATNFCLPSFLLSMLDRPRVPSTSR